MPCADLHFYFSSSFRSF